MIVPEDSRTSRADDTAPGGARAEGEASAGARADASGADAAPRVPEHLRARLESGAAVAWEETLVLPTYEPDPPSELPMYLDGRVYQGSSGRVYPMPFVEGVAREAVPHAWRAVHLENRYVRLTVLPELGGRIHSGLDKTTGYDFFYRNHVIKPALVGLDGPWLSGGVELNWPQHHRPATYFPTDADVELSDDGSAVVWCRDHDPFARMSGIHGIRLHAGRSVVEIAARLHNRTEEMRTFLWWANAAVRVHDAYQSFFPQDVRYVADHARRAVTAFPRADRPYYGVDYPALAAERPDADRIDFYANIPVPTSYMIVDTDESFFGGYDHAAGAGLVHWADRRISPGKKQWTWGNAPFGHAWDRHLTDEDGPYIELMAGVYTDNQPDFSWLRPGEVKRFSQFWYPIPGIGPAHQATQDAAVNVELCADRGIRVRAAVTRPVDLIVRVEAVERSAGSADAAGAGRAGADGRGGVSGRALVAESRADAEPGDVRTLDAVLPDGVAPEDVRVTLLAAGADNAPCSSTLLQSDAQRDTPVGRRDTPASGRRIRRNEMPSEPGGASRHPSPASGEARVLLEWRLVTGDAEEPWAATVPPEPAEVESVDELYLTGLHLQQYRHPTRSPLPYWEEAIRRDPQESRTRLALAWHAYAAGSYAEARAHVEVAIARQTVRNERLRDTEPFYLAGLVAVRLGEHERAERLFGRAGWDGAWASASGLEGAALAARLGRTARAAADAEELAAGGCIDPRLDALRVVLARRVGRDAGPAIEAARARGPLDDLMRHLAGGGLPDDGGRLVDLALDLARFGETEAALAALEAASVSPITPAGNVRPVAHYLRAALLAGAGREDEAASARVAARAADRRWCFPAGLDAHDALIAALRADAADGVAGLLLGMLLYDAGRRDDALAAWDAALAAGLDDPVLHRNRALAAYEIEGDDDRAWAGMERARELSPDSARLLYEQDRLAERLGHDAGSRLARLEASPALVGARDDLAVEYAVLLTAVGRADEALAWLEGRAFQPWEGGEGRVLAAWDAARDALGLGVGEPPLGLGEARPVAAAPAAVHEDGSTDYFATSLPEALLWRRR